MAKKAGAYKKFTKKKGYKRYKSVQMNYFRVKTEFNDRLVFDYAMPGTADGANNGGYCFFVTRAAQVGQANRNHVTLGDLLNQYVYTNMLEGLFSYYRPTGIKIEALPESRNQSLPSSFQIQNVVHNIPFPQVMISYRAGSNAGQTLQEVRANNQSLVLNTSQKVARYWKIYGTTTSYDVTTSRFTGAFTVQNAFPNTQSEQDQTTRSMMVYRLMPSWQIKISVYYLYKYSRA